LRDCELKINCDSKNWRCKVKVFLRSCIQTKDLNVLPLSRSNTWHASLLYGGDV
jgi:hypothetical protein